jgi:hypothetical protein
MLPNARVAATDDALRALSCGYYSQLSHIALCCFNNERKHTPRAVYEKQRGSLG